jgi:hypothetical protein
MPFGLPITIREAVEHIHKKEYLLPAIHILPNSTIKVGGKCVANSVVLSPAKRVRTIIWWRIPDSNRGPADYDSVALTS